MNAAPQELHHRPRRQSRLAAREVVAIAHTGNLLTDQKNLLRADMQAAGGDVLFRKNSLAKIALERAGKPSLVPLVSGRVAIAAGDADVGVAKALMALQKKVPSFFVLGATLGERTLEWSDVERLAKLPPREEVFADLLAQIMPGGRLGAAARRAAARRPGRDRCSRHRAAAAARGADRAAQKRRGRIAPNFL